MSQNNYDVVVIGAGNGGLMAAGYCAKNGLKTLLIEKHNIPGGCATSFVRGRFEFEPSLHELCYVGTEERQGDVYKFFKGLDANIKWYYDDVLFRVINKSKDGYDAILMAGEDAFVESMEKACPGSRESAKKFLQIAKITSDAMDYMKTVKIPTKFFTEYIDFLKAGCYSTDYLLDYLKMPKKAQNILKTYWSYLGVPTDDLIGMQFASMVWSYVYDKPTMPAHRSHELSLAICKSIYDNGGDVWYNSAATGLIFDEKGKVIGVKVGEKEVFAKEVISNAMPNVIYDKIDKKYIPKQQIKYTNARKFGLSMVTVYLGLDCTKEELGLDDYTTFITTTADTREQYDRCGEGVYYIVNCLNAVIPDATPSGTSTLFFTIPMFDKDFPKDLTPDKYKKWKNEFVKKYILDAEKTLKISIMPHIEEIVIATPVTFARYLNTPQGAIYGYETSGWDNVMLRSVGKNFEKQIPGLSFVGGHCEHGDGYSSSYTIGHNVAMGIVNKLKKGGK